MTSIADIFEAVWKKKFIIPTVVVLGGWFSFSQCTEIVQPGESKVLSVLGKAQAEPLTEGFHFVPPFVSRTTNYDITVQKFQVPATAATKDLQDLTGTFAINFRIDDSKLVEIKRTQGSLENIQTKIIAPQAQEAFKLSSAGLTAEESITKRAKLKEDFDKVLKERLGKYHITVLDTSIVNIKFSAEFAKAVEEKQVAEQKAQRAVFVAQEANQQAEAQINLARGKAESARLEAKALKEQGGDLVLQKEAIEAWKSGGAQMPKVLVIGENGGSAPFLFNLDGLNNK